MITPSETPSYVPAPHLIASSPLTAAQLLTQFQDFRGSLRHVSTAPELVFERLVANFNEAFNAALELERAQHATALQSYQSSIIELKEQVTELKQALSMRRASEMDESGLCSSSETFGSPPRSKNQRNPPGAIAVVKSRRNPTVGTFDTNELRSWKQARAKTSKVVTFAKPYTASPGLPIGLTMVDTGQNANARVKAYTSGIQKDRFEVHLDTWEDTTLYSAACNWLEIPADDPDFQFGSYSTLEDHPWYQPQTHSWRKITFKRQYSTPPTVVVWLTAFDMRRNKNWRLKTFATDVTKSGFTINIDTWEDSVLYSAVASWLAYTANRDGICSGRFSTLDLHTWHHPQLYNSAYETFSGLSNAFSAPPHGLFLAIDSLDIKHGHNLRLAVKASSISATGMTWHLDAWEDTILYSAGASYIALGSTSSPTHDIARSSTSSPAHDTLPTSGPTPTRAFSRLFGF